MLHGEFIEIIIQYGGDHIGDTIGLALRVGCHYPTTLNQASAISCAPANVVCTPSVVQ